MNFENLKQNIQGRWMHSHEEDNESSFVYRPVTFAFPRSRGRIGFELKPDNTLIEIQIGQADGSFEQEGLWSLDAQGNLCLSINNRREILQVISAEKDKLVLRKK